MCVQGKGKLDGQAGMWVDCCAWHSGKSPLTGMCPSLRCPCSHLPFRSCSASARMLGDTEGTRIKIRGWERAAEGVYLRKPKD